MDKKYTKEQIAEHRKQWLDALRSGKYKQGKGSLRKDDSYCCLGVACDLSELGEWMWNPDESAAYYLDNASVLPSPVQDWLGFGGCNPVIRRDGSYNTLASLNDGYDGYEECPSDDDDALISYPPLSFEEIADIIEKELF